ncbi:MAG: hypothetical protein GFH27_549311n119 [Chloroflexi bacterium AL-W]|nr:hypothetical protein [Chloroflexi bacterium AL-N1]NOK68703.1 hypothetical protein [Chloroflexi bacterium AL-N10]NOK76189.1 hypothetical protein [Chloroflexi bacterium AL-N5]NOK84174.1 hypothetical protein [Chloroflexi bacterium AL-W]NOK91327.1 hypothetical protein [Chloroflexi bacterium AL-N15]
MNMGAVLAVFATLLTTGIAFVGLLMTWSLLLPRVVERAHVRLRQTPWRCFFLGLSWLLLAVPAIGILLSIPAGLGQMLGWVGIFVLLTIASIGATGLATLMVHRLRDETTYISSQTALLRSAGALSLAVVFPVLGWLIILPLVAICSLGAAGFALLHWKPRTKSAPNLTEAVHATHTS